MGAKRLVTFGRDAWRLLKGLSCVCKPIDMPVEDIPKILAVNITQDLNKMRRVSSDTCRADNHSNSTNIKVNNHGSDVGRYTNHPLVLGDGFEPEDIYIDLVNDVTGYRTSGLSLVSINMEGESLKEWQSLVLPTVYRVTFKYGHLTDTNFTDGRVTEKATYSHLRGNPAKLTSLLGSIQHHHRRNAIRDVNVSLQSQRAYELAIRGSLRPEQTDDPVFYSMDVVSYKVPEVIIDITGVNIDEACVGQLVNDMSYKLKTCAAVESIRIMRFGPFYLKDSLPISQWQLEPVIKNILNVEKIIHDNPQVKKKTRHLNQL